MNVILRNEREKEIFAEAFRQGFYSDEELRNKVRIMEAMWVIEREVKEEKPMTEERFTRVVKGIIKALER